MDAGTITVWKEGGAGMRMGIVQGVRGICLPGPVCKRKRKIKRLDRKIAANLPPRHIANPIAGNGACAGDRHDNDGAERLDFLMEEGGFPCLCMAQDVFPVLAFCFQTRFRV